MNFYHQLEELASQNIEEMNLNLTMRKLHMLHKNDPNYKKILQENFDLALASGSYEEYIKVALWFAEIYNLDPNYSPLFPAFRNSFYNGAVENILRNDQKFEKLATMAARLIDYDQLHDLLKDLKTVASQTDEYSKQIMGSLDLINEVIVWQMDRKAIYLKSRRYQALKMIKNILKEFKQMPDLNIPKFMPQKMKILHSILLYLDSENPHKNKTVLGETLSFKTAIIEQLTSYEEVELLNQDSDMFLDLLAATIKLYGIFDQTKIEKLLRKYKLKTQNFSYLNLLKTIAERSTQKVSRSTKQVMQYIIQILISKFFSNESSTLSVLFKVLKTKSDIIIEGNKKNFMDLTRYLSECLDKTHISFHKMFLTSLLVIYNPTVRKEVHEEFSNQPSVFTQNKHQAIYYQMIEYFASIDFQIRDYLEDPESTDNLVWGLLALRNSIKANYYFLSQKDFVPIIFKNLVKLMLANISSLQCKQLAQELLNKNLNAEDRWRKVMDYAFIIKEFQQLAFTIPVQALNHFCDLLKKHIQSFGKEIFDNLQLFKQLCILGTKLLQELTDQYQQLKIKYIQTFFNLLRTTIPRKNSGRIELNEIYEARDCLITLIAFDLKNAFYSIYLDLAFAFRQTDAFEGIARNPRINNTQTYQKFDFMMYRKFEIMGAISRKAQVSFEQIQDNWSKFVQSIYQRDNDLGLYFLQFNQYFLRSLKDQVEAKDGSKSQYSLFLKFQLVQLNSALNIIYKLIEEESLISSLQNLLEINTALSLNLYKVLTEIEKYAEMINLQQQTLLDLCLNMIKWFKILDKIGSKQFLREQNGMTVSLWRSAQTFLIMTASLSYQMCRMNHLDINFSYQVMKKKLQCITKDISQVERHKLDLSFSQLFSSNADLPLRRDA